MANLPVNTCRKAPAVSALSFQNAYFKDRWPGLSWIQKQGCRPVKSITQRQPRKLHRFPPHISEASRCPYYTVRLFCQMRNSLLSRY